VPFGEYVPLQRFFPFVKRLVPAAGDFASGESVKPLKLPDVSAGVLICFEVIFPELARLQIKNGAEILINMTNDAWFGRTGAPYQHLSMAVFRAVENRRPLVRAANTGISAFIGPTGKVLKNTELFTEGILTEAVRIYGSSPGFYTRYGDLLVFALMVIISIKFLYHLCYHKKFSEADRKYHVQ
jgi:apolipoprotein N-acyltransferase